MKCTMKNLIYLIALLGIILALPVSSQDLKTDNTESEPAFLVSSPQELSGIAADWVSEFNRTTPGESAEYLPLEPANKNIHLVIASDVTLYKISGNIEGKMLIGRDILVPVISVRNPLMEELKRKGMTREQLTGMLEANGKSGWAVTGAGDKKYPVHYYYIPESSAAIMVQRFIQKDLPGTGWIEVTEDAELVNKVASDPNGIAFAHLTSIAGEGFNTFVDGIAPLPLDRNSNGSIDYFEDVYASPAALSRGSWVGKYPHELVNGLYAVTLDAPLSMQEKSFVKWILAEGQAVLPAVGYADLLGAERKTKIDLLSEPIMAPAIPQEKYSTARTVIMVFIVLLIIGLVIESFILYFRSIRNEKALKNIREVRPFSTASLHLPKGLFFDKSHTWAYMEQNGLVKMGIDDFLPHITGKYTGLKMKKPGQRVNKGEVIMTLVQKGKQLDIKSPVSGIIAEQNQSLNADASLLNSSPYHDGWVYRIEPTNWLREIQFMFMADKFRSWLGGEFNRFKDFLARMQHADRTQVAHVVLQEGGELQDGILAELGPEAWDDFQEMFMDTTA